MRRFALQSAMEYLMTYGWAILIVAIALSALYFLGVFKPNSFVSPECLLQAGFGCQYFTMTGNGLLTLTLLQTNQDPINITAIGCYSQTANKHFADPDNPPTNQIYMSSGANYTFLIQCYNSSDGPFRGNIGDVYTGSLIINYTDQITGFPSQAGGTLIDKVTSP